jgi:chorismate dehydratase
MERRMTDIPTIQPNEAGKTDEKPAAITPPTLPMRIGTFPFLNIQPLIWSLKERGHRLSSHAPSEMGLLLKEGKLDAAIAPVVVSFLNPELPIVPVAAIGSKGPVKSVRLLSHGQLQLVERLFADTRSQTSVLLARLILKKWYGVKKPEVKPMDIENFKPGQTKPWEAVLQIGDIALESAPYGMTVTDLGEEWFFRTGKPFVFALWLARDTKVAAEIEADLLDAKKEGLQHIDDIVGQYRGIWVSHRPQAKEYLETNMNFNYGPEEIQGQMEFQRLLKEEGFIL